MYVLGSDEDVTGDSTIKSYYQPLPEDKNIGPGEYDPKIIENSKVHTFAKTERDFIIKDKSKEGLENVGPGSYKVNQ